LDINFFLKNAHLLTFLQRQIVTVDPATKVFRYICLRWYLGVLLFLICSEF